MHKKEALLVILVIPCITSCFIRGKYNIPETISVSDCIVAITPHQLDPYDLDKVEVVPNPYYINDYCDFLFNDIHNREPICSVRCYAKAKPLYKFTCPDNKWVIVTDDDNSVDVNSFDIESISYSDFYDRYHESPEACYSRIGTNNVFPYRNALKIHSHFFMEYKENSSSLPRTVYYSEHYANKWVKRYYNKGPILLSTKRYDGGRIIWKHDLNYNYVYLIHNDREITDTLVWVRKHNRNEDELTIIDDECTITAFPTQSVVYHSARYRCASYIGERHFIQGVHHKQDSLSGSYHVNKITMNHSGWRNRIIVNTIL